jgi:hypothetical protein
MSAISALLFAAALSAAPPAAIDTQDFAWLRGAFPDSTASDRSRWAAVKAYGDACEADAVRAAKTQVEAAGGKADALKPGIYDAPEPCTLVILARYALPHIKSWAAFDAALREVRPRFLGFMQATTIAEQVAAVDDKAPLAERLHAATVGEQVLRLGLSWNEGANAAPDRISDDARYVLAILLWVDITKRDHANTAMLQALVKTHGWPKISEVGRRGAQDAWLLAQHADDHPAFQVRALAAMKPLLASKEVLPRSYAYLADRVSKALTGTQVYGTQFDCVAGHYVPTGIKTRTAVDAARASVGLGSLADAQKDIEKAYGPHC